MLTDQHELVFVAGLHRSGTTPMTRLLAGHPDVSGFAGTGEKEDEGQHLQDVYPPARAYGGAGRFAFDPAAHLTEASPTATPDAAARLLAAWAPHWDLDRRILVEKSPPNLVMTRYLQHLFPSARFVVMVRHPAVVALSTGRWRRTSSVRRLLEHWLVAHETFLADAAHLRRVTVVSYERLVADPDRELDRLAAFLGLDTPIPASTWQAHRSDAYERAWHQLTRGGPPWRRLRIARTIADLGPRVERFGYDLRDLGAVREFPAVGGGAGSTAPPG